MPALTPTPQGYDQTSVRSRCFFHWRASDLSLSTLSGGDDLEVTRNSDGNARDTGGRLYTLQSDRPRWHSVLANDGSEYVGLLAEAGTTNEFTRAKELDHGDWTKDGVSVNANQARGPKDTKALEELVEDGATGEHVVFQSQTLTADADYALSAFAIAGDRTWLRLALVEGGTGNRVDEWFNLSTGATGTQSTGGTGSFTRSYVEDWTAIEDGLYRCVLVGSVGNAATSINGNVALADADGSISYNGDGSSSLYAGFAQLEDDTGFASSYVQSTGSNGTRSDGYLQRSIGWTPADIRRAGGMTAYYRWIEGGTAFRDSGVGTWWHIGGPGSASDPRLQLRSNSGADGVVQFAFVSDSPSFNASTAASSVSVGDDCEALAEIFLDGSTWKIRLTIWANGAQVDQNTATVGSDLPDDWSAGTLTINAAPDEINHGTSTHRILKVIPGQRTITEARGIL